ncbi:MAG: hypothetical protein QXD82_05360 [Nitrososphaerales archaeon]
MMKSSIENVEIKQTKKILRVLDRAKTPVPLGYISLHTGIEEPLEILEKMRKNGLVKKSPSSSWSCCMDPMYEIVPKVKKGLHQTLVRQ